jgi:hypothetical protein
MKNIIRGFVAIIIVSLAYSGSSQAESFVKVRGLGWDSAIKGTVQVDRASMAGSSINLRRDLGMTDSVIVPEIEGKIGFLGADRWIVAYSQGSYDGRKTIGKNISFAGKTFLASETINTRFDISLASLMYEYAPLPEGVLPSATSTEPEMGLLLGVKYFHLASKITSSSSVTEASDTFGFPIPVIGLRVQGRVADNVQLESAGTWMSIKGNNGSLYWSDLYGELKFSFAPKIPFGLGYKLNRLSAESDSGPDFSSRAGFRGWYLMASIEL